MADSQLIHQYDFRGVDYNVQLNRLSEDNSKCVTIQVEDKQTADQWRATFDQTCKVLLQRVKLY